MAENVGVKLFELSDLLWRSVFKAAKSSLVYMDNGAAEILHWSGRTLDLIGAGAKRVLSLDCGVVHNGGKKDNKAVFIVSSLLQGKTVEKLQKIIEPSYFQHCSIFSMVSDGDNAMVLRQGGHSENEFVFEKIKETVQFWMNNMYATVEVLHLPFVHANVIPGVFVMPSFSSSFPTIPSDMTKIQEWLQTKADQKSFNSLSEIELHHMPQVFQVKLKLLASALACLFDGLNLTEDCYGIGHTAKMLAAEVANLSSTKVKKPGGRCSVIFVDRSLDLVQPCSRSAGTLADKILGLLPKLPGHSLDVMVDMSSVCTSGSVNRNVIVPGSLAHDPSNKRAQSILTSMVTKKSQDYLVDMYESLVRVLKDESLSFEEENPRSKVTAEKLSSLMAHFRKNFDVFIRHSALLQLGMATVKCLEHEDNHHLQQIQGTEKVVQLSLNEENSPSCLSHIFVLLKNVREGTRSYCLEDIILLVLFVYSLVGEEGLESAAEENQLKNVIIRDVVSGTLRVKSKFIVDIEKDTEDVVKNKIGLCFERMSKLKNLREDLTLFRDLFTLSSPSHDLRSYQPILKQIISKVFDPKKPDISDIEFKSTRLKDYIKSGFSLFMNVSKPHPSDHSVLFLFVLGGITTTEVQQIKEVLRSQNIKTKVIIGSTNIVNSNDILRSLFFQDNVFPNLNSS